MQLEKRIAKLAHKTHKDRVSEFNAHLESLSEHHDIPKACLYYLLQHKHRFLTHICIGWTRIRLTNGFCIAPPFAICYNGFPYDIWMFLLYKRLQCSYINEYNNLFNELTLFYARFWA